MPSRRCASSLSMSDCNKSCGVCVCVCVGGCVCVYQELAGA